MATVLSTARRLGGYRYTQAEIEPWLSRWLEGNGEARERAIRMCRNSQVGARASVVPIEEVFRERTFEEKNDIYRENAIILAEDAARRALEEAGAAPEEVDIIISVSCTGFMIPAVDAYLINRLGLRPEVKRLPMTEMGCAAGATALARAWEYLRAFPEHKALVVSVELATLTFQPRDFSMDNLVSAAIFGDGAAAAVLGGAPGPGARIEGCRTTTLPGTLHLFGFRLSNTGFRIILSRGIPAAVRARLRPIVEGFLGEHGLALPEVRHLIFHPGGKRIIEVYRDELGLPEEALRFSAAMLSAHGNLSSSSVLVILDDILRRGEAAPGDAGLLLAMGPGFTIEQLLLRWHG
ncbi:MAG: type III polyketide synthase [Candidatus Tectomicrobia bacterium]|uniref:Type III polyketide synthase n=1 Tax=Tectimicrobiota bacterium TaxID=2528274 RepID=A0A932I3J1_UNCTE|nr:type III polyketide synthase [Candidatus Tectomicrobia bacterium]